MKAYLSFPITGYDEKERRRFAAMTSEMLMRKYFFDVVNPLHIADKIKKMHLDEGNWDEPTYEEYMSADIKQLLECDVIIFCQGWYLSDGCLEEYIEALRANIPAYIISGESIEKLWKYDSSCFIKQKIECL